MSKILDWNDYENTARQAIAEGCVLLENKNNVLPLAPESTVAIFGRIQSSYYKSGTGSGGKVNVAKVYNIVEGLEEAGIKVNQELKGVYAEWEKTHPYDEGLGWGKERWSQDEMPLTKEIIDSAAKASETAVVIIGRTAGEDKDNSATKGSYLLTDEEMDMLSKVRAGFNKMVVLLNVGNIIDMSFVDTCKPDAVMYVWQGGMTGGLGTADALTGKIAPGGKLTDTIAYNITDYPSDKYFGNKEGNTYVEDIYVGYRYFETFAPEKVRYAFGYGLTYTEFSVEAAAAKNDAEKQQFTVKMQVKNTGAASGKEVVQIYVKAPDGKLGKAEKVLVDFEKTETLKAGQSQELTFTVPYYSFASFDDSDASNPGNNKRSFVLEGGKYTVYAGNSVRNTKEVLSFELPFITIQECEEALGPEFAFERFHKDNQGKVTFETVPATKVNMQERRKERLPEEYKQTGNKNLKLADVQNGKCSVIDFVSQFSDEDLSCIIRGEGMGSSLVTAGTASAYGGVSLTLRESYGIPAACCDDGPSGMRLDCGIKAFALPNGTSLACTFNKALVTKLYTFTGLEMTASKVDNLLGPGMNIHRHPCNGRNFEYFSEDPYVTGQIGTAMIKGLKAGGVTGTIKHFCGNNQETLRYSHNSKISERALREIYLKPFEIAVKSGYSDSIMTTYGLVNGVYTAGNYDLNTTILRKDWGFKGIVMTDWWAAISEPGVPADKNNFAGMVKAQNDLYMVCPDGSQNLNGDNTLESLSKGELTRGELQRCAVNICNHMLDTLAMKRLTGTDEKIEIINRPASKDDINIDDVEFIFIEKEKNIDLTYQESKAEANYILPFDVKYPGTYEVSITASSDLDELAQLPCTLFYQGIPVASFTFNGTKGKDMTITKTLKCPNRFCICRLFVASNGLKLKEFNIKYLNDDTTLVW